MKNSTVSIKRQQPRDEIETLRVINDAVGCGEVVVVNTGHSRDE